MTIPWAKELMSVEFRRMKEENKIVVSVLVGDTYTWP
jgi:hypothetical protein